MIDFLVTLLVIVETFVFCLLILALIVLGLGVLHKNVTKLVYIIEEFLK